MKISVTKLAIYLVVFLTILENSTMWSLIPDTLLTQDVIYVCQCVSIIFAFFAFEKKRIDVTCIRCLIIGIAYMSIYLLATRVNVLSFGRNLMFPLFLYFVFCCQIFANKKFSYIISAYGNIMFIVASLSLICWLFGSLLNVLPGRMLISYDWAERVLPSYTYGYLYFENPTQSSGSLIRNTGIYAEAPGYSAYLLFAIGLELFAYKKIRKGRFAVLCATLISTFSTKGQVLLVIIIALKCIFQKGTSTKIMLCVKLFVSTVIVAGGLFLLLRIITEKSTSVSYIIRMDDLSSTLKAWISSPIWGVGYGNYEAIQSYFSVHRDNSGLSMGLAVLLAYGGLWLLIFYIGAFVIAITRPAIRPYRRNIVFFSMLVLMNLFISNQCFNPITILMVACGYATFLKQGSVPSLDEHFICKWKETTKAMP